MFEQESQQQMDNPGPAPLPVPEYTPYPVTEPGGRLTLVAVFADGEGARACARNLEARGVEVAMALEEAGSVQADPSAPGAAVAGESVRPKERPMGRGVVIGATIGGTAGFLAATYLVPPGMGFATGSMLTTLAGAGLGTFFGSLAEYGGAERRREAGAEAEADSRPGASPGAGRVGGSRVLVTARVEQGEAEEVRGLIALWNPQEIRVQ